MIASETQLTSRQQADIGLAARITGLAGPAAVHEALTTFLAARMVVDGTVSHAATVETVLADCVKVDIGEYSITSSAGDGQVTQKCGEPVLKKDEIHLRFADYDEAMSTMEAGHPIRWTDRDTLCAVEAVPSHVYADAIAGIAIVCFSITLGGW